MNKSIVALSIIFGIIFLGLSVLYFITPANNLPHFLPGFDSTVTKTHYKHGIGSALLGLGLFAFAWFRTGKKSPEEVKGNQTTDN